MSEHKNTQLYPGVSGTGEYIPIPPVDLQAAYDEYFIVAAWRGDLLAVKYSLEQGANIHAYQDVALEKALETPYLHVAEYLLERGADFRFVQHTGTLDSLPLMDAFPIVHSRKELLAMLPADKQEQYRAFTDMIKKSMGNNLGGMVLNYM